MTRIKKVVKILLVWFPRRGDGVEHKSIRREGRAGSNIYIYRYISNRTLVATSSKGIIFSSHDTDYVGMNVSVTLIPRFSLLLVIYQHLALSRSNFPDLCASLMIL